MKKGAQIQSNERFLYYQEDGFYKIKQIECGYVRIKYTQGLPLLRVFSPVPDNSFINRFSLNLFTRDQYYIIEVPIGTIKNNYSLDAQ